MPMQPGQSQNIPGKEGQQEQSVPSKDQPGQQGQTPGQKQGQQEQAVPGKQQPWQTPGQQQSDKPSQPC